MKMICTGDLRFDSTKELLVALACLGFDLCDQDWLLGFLGGVMGES